MLRVQRYGWDKAAEFYEGFWRDQLLPAQEKLLEMAALRPGERVVEIACGTGLVTFPAARAVGVEGAVVATDISESMIRVVKEQAAAMGLDHVRTKRCDAENLDLENASYDAALCGLGLMYAPDPGAALGEMFRVLRSGGRAVAAVWGKRDRCGWAEIFPIVDSRVNTEVCPMFFHLGNGETLGTVFSSAGFENVRTERIRTTLLYPSPEDAVAAVFLGGPVAMAYSRFDDATRESAHAEYLASIEPYRKDSRYEIPGEFVITFGSKP